jgi:hypothetical protein
VGLAWAQTKHTLYGNRLFPVLLHTQPSLEAGLLFIFSFLTGAPLNHPVPNCTALTRGVDVMYLASGISPRVPSSLEDQRQVPTGGLASPPHFCLVSSQSSWLLRVHCSCLPPSCRLLVSYAPSALAFSLASRHHCGFQDARCVRRCRSPGLGRSSRYSLGFHRRASASEMGWTRRATTKHTAHEGDAWEWVQIPPGMPTRGESPLILPMPAPALLLLRCPREA